MPTRKRGEWKPDSRGQYVKQIGWKQTIGGRRGQHKFRLGNNRREAERREARLRSLWDMIERRVSEFHFEGALWSDLTLDWAKQIADGVYPPEVTLSNGETPREYAERLLELRFAFAGFSLEPRDVTAFEVGLTQIERNPREVGHYIQSPLPQPLVTNSECPTIRMAPRIDPVAADSCWLGPTQSELVQFNATRVDAPIDTGERFHAALQSFQDHLRQSYRVPVAENGTGVSDWGHTQIRQVKSLIVHHDDCPLLSLDLEGIEALFNYWRGRPNKVGAEKPVSRDTAGNQITQLKSFFRWLHRTKGYDWRKPDEFVELDTRVTTLKSDRTNGFEQVETFNLNELTMLAAYATPLERCLLLLALNCGFGEREIATLRWDQVALREGHTPHLQEKLGTRTSDADSFIKRHRTKTSAYGEWLLFPQTVQAIEWLRKRYDALAAPKEPLVVLNDRGQPYYYRTKAGNINSQIPNRFRANRDRAQKDGQAIPNYSFGKLRKTAGDIIKRFSDGEVAGVFLTHAQSVKTDDLSDAYTNRAIGRLFDTLRTVQEFLKPIFDAAGSEPFVPSPQAYTPKSVCDEIVRLAREDVSAASIAEAVGVSVMTVYRHIDRGKEG